MEIEHVHKVYDQIAQQFDQTRFSRWNGVVGFLQTLRAGSSILDVGCGNGKYLNVREDCVMHACDPCSALVDIAAAKRPDAHVTIGNVLDLPYDDSTFDAVICIAVLHHLSTPEKRNRAFQEIARVLRPKGRAFITVWATSAYKSKWGDMHNGDVMVPWVASNDQVHQRYYHLFEREELLGLCTHMVIENVFLERDNWHVSLVKN